MARWSRCSTSCGKRVCRRWPLQSDPQTPARNDAGLKRLLPNLVLVLALALCALCIVQWVREARLRAKIESLQQTNQIDSQSLANSEALARRYEAEISRLDARVKELKRAEQTNSAVTTTLQADLRKAEAEAESFRKAIASYKEAVDRQ